MPFPDATGNPVLNAIFARTSVRRYTGEPPTPEQLRLIVQAGMAAPSAVDRRPWEFIVVTRPDILEQLRDRLPHCKMVAQAGSAVVVVGDRLRQHRGFDLDYWIMDCSAAVQNILLAATALGLGAVWTAAYPDPLRVAAVREILNMPQEHLVPLAVIPIGTPAGDETPKDKWDPTRVHMNAFGNPLK